MSPLLEADHFRMIWGENRDDVFPRVWIYIVVYSS